MYIYYQPNPCGRSVRDCSIRALTMALGVSWETAFDLAAKFAKNMCDMPDSDWVWGAVLRSHGYKRVTIPNNCPECYTVAQFAKDHQSGIYVLGLGGHVTVIKDGDIYDIWDTSNEVPIYAWY